MDHIYWMRINKKNLVVRLKKKRKGQRSVHTSGAKSLGAFDDTKLYISSIWKGESCTTECADDLSWKKGLVMV